MVNLNHILKYRNCPTLESRLHDDKETTMNDEEKEYGVFPPRDQLFERKNFDFYEEDPVLKILMEHYQTFFEKGIDFLFDGKPRNVYPTGSILWYYNEAFSLCTKLSIDPSPEHYFIDEYYDDIDGECTQIECCVVLSIVYALLAVNVKVRRQHLKMIDVLGNFLIRRCPFSVMCECMTFITETYVDDKSIMYEFSPAVDHYGYTRLNVDEGLAGDEEEQMDLITQMRKKVCNYWLKYSKKFNVKPSSDPSEELLTAEAQPYWTKLKEKGFIVEDGYGLANGVSPYDATYIAEQFSATLGIKNKWKVFEPLWGLKNMAQHKNDYTNKTTEVAHQKEIDEIFGVTPKKLTKI